MNYIVLDLEWNQCPYGKNYTIKQLPFEIIEIGAVKLDDKLNILGEFHRIIKPKKYKKLHFQTQKILHITDSQLNKGMAFDVAMDQFFDWCGDDYMFCTWGMSDLTELQRNMEYFGVENFLPKPLKYYELQELMSIELNEDEKRRSLESAVEYYNIEETRDFHGALEDAYYTVKVMQCMKWDKLKQFYAVNCYYPPLTEDEEVFVVYPHYSRFVSREYATKERAMKNKYIANNKCIHCNRTLRPKIKWFVANQKLYEGVYKCPFHGLMLGKIRFKSSPVGNYYVIKTLEDIDKARYEAVVERKELIKEKKKQRKRMIKERRLTE